MEDLNKAQSHEGWKSNAITESLPNPKLKVMVIEDDVRMLGLYRRIFEQNGHSIVLEAESAAESLDKFRQAFQANDGKRPSLVIADYRLPDGNGLEVSKELLKLDPDLEIVLATADPIKDEVVFQSGVTKILRKPFTMEKLLSEISTVANGERRTKEKESDGGVRCE